MRRDAGAFTPVKIDAAEKAESLTRLSPRGHKTYGMPLGEVRFGGSGPLTICSAHYVIIGQQQTQPPSPKGSVLCRRSSFRRGRDGDQSQALYTLSYEMLLFAVVNFVLILEKIELMLWPIVVRTKTAAAPIKTNNNEYSTIS